MNKQKILIIITIALVVIVIGSILLVKPSPKLTPTPIPIPRIDITEPVIIKITQISPPENLAAEYSPLTPIEITFSTDFNLDKLEITTNPKTEIIYYVVNSKTLRLLPKTAWTLGKTDFTLLDGSRYSLNTAWPRNPDENTVY